MWMRFSNRITAAVIIIPQIMPDERGDLSVKILPH
jgi:hypothetical protein